jgi:hypothetical protein
MEHSIDFVDGGTEDVLVRTYGRAAVGALNACVLEVVRDARFAPGMAVLVDHTALDASDLVTGDARTVASTIADLGERAAGTAIACVAPGPVMFGICRAFEVFSESSGIRARVFTTADAARAWLAETKLDD